MERKEKSNHKPRKLILQEAIFSEIRINNLKNLKFINSNNE